MIHYAWEPWRDHEWLSVDRDGRIGCFMSCCPEVLPDDILIPWPYLHNVLGSWVAYRLGCRFVELNWSDRMYDEQVAMLADSGLFVWDAERKTAGAKAVFRLIAKPGRPIGLPEIDAYFSKIIKSFVVAGESFESAEELHNVRFGNKANITQCQVVNCPEVALSWMECDGLLDLVRSGRAFEATVAFADRCRLEDAPLTLGPTFSCWDAVRPSYLRLMERIAEVLVCSKVEVCELTGKSGAYDIAELSGLTKSIPLPFLSAEFCRRDGSWVRVTFHIEDVIGGPACLPSGYLHDYESEMHVENWQFNVTISPPATPCPLLSRLLAAFGLRFARNNQFVI